MTKSGWIFLTALLILLTVGTCKGETPPPQDKCQSALSACDTYASSLEEQVKLLKDEAEAYKKEVGKTQNTPIVLYMALGGAAGGGVMGVYGGRGNGLVGAGVGTVMGALLGYTIKGLAQ